LGSGGTVVPLSGIGATPLSGTGWLGGGTLGGAPQIPEGAPGVVLQVMPAQQSAVAVQAPPELTHTGPTPPGGGTMQRKTPSLPGTQGTPLQHSAEKVQR
jgi:hypothetical protein